LAHHYAASWRGAHGRPFDASPVGRLVTGHRATAAGSGVRSFARIRSGRQWAGRLLGAPQLATEEATFFARTFQRVPGLTLGVSILGLAALVILQLDTLGRPSLNVAVLVLLGFLLTAMNRRGWTRAASWFLVAGLTGLIAIRAYTSGGMEAPLTTGFVVVAMLANLLPDGRLVGGTYPAGPRRAGSGAFFRGAAAPGGPAPLPQNR